ncbi:MAG: DUF1513 domain-containing protein [Bdellovibrionota bacterium]
MDRRSFIGNLFTVAAAIGARPAWAASLPEARPQGFSPAQLKEQILEDLGSLSHFRLLYLAANQTGGTELVCLNTKRMRVEKVIAANMEKRHSILVPPGADPEFALLPEENGTRAALVSLKKGMQIGECTPADGWLFSGHGTFAPDGKSVYLTEFPEKPGASEGHVVERAIPSLAVLKTLKSGRYRPHDVKLVNGGKALLVGHLGRSKREKEPASGGDAMLLEIPLGKLLPIAIYDNPYAVFAHVEADELGNFFASTSSSIGGDTQLMSPVLFGSRLGKKWTSPWSPVLKDRFRGNFSLRLAKKAGVLAVNHTDGRMTSLWQSRTGRALDIVEFGQEKPLGLEVTPDERYFLVSTASGALFFVDVHTRRIVKRTNLLGLGGSAGSQFCVLPA